MSVFWSPSPARLMKTVQIQDAYAEEELVEALDNATVGDLIITTHNNIVPIEMQIGIQEPSVYVFGNSQDEGISGNVVSDSVITQSIFPPESLPICEVDAGSFYFWAIQPLQNVSQSLFQFSFKNDPLVMGASNVTSNDPNFVGVATAFFKGNYYALAFDSNVPRNYL